MSFLTEASKNIINLPRFAKRVITIIVDLGLCILCTWLAFYLRFEQFIKINDVEYNYNLDNHSINLIEKMIITRGSSGAEYNGIMYPVDKVDVRDTSGAGDTFLAGLVYAYINGNNIFYHIQKSS